MEELRKKLMEELKNKLGEGYEVSPVDVNKNNGTILHGISIMLKGNIGGPTVYVDNFYQRFQGTNEEIEEMIDYILEDIRSCYEIDDEELQRNVYEYDRAKEHLRVALCNYEANKETLSSRPHKRILDLAVTACIRSETTPVRGSGFISVSNRLLQIWGVSEEEMFDIALENTMKEEVCCKLSDLLAQEEGLELPPGVEIPMYILTTNDKRLGASMLLNVAALTRIAEELHSNLFIYPSSIHEVLVLPVEGTRKQRAKQKKMVEEVNASSVSPEERLSKGIKYPNLPGSGRQKGSDYYHVCRTGEKICVRKEGYQKYLYAHLVMRSQKKMQKRNMSSASTTKGCSEEESLSAALLNTLLLRLITQTYQMRSSGRAYKSQWLSPVISS